MGRKKNPEKREWQPREMRFVSEFVAKFYPEEEARFHVRLGSTPERFKGQFTSEETARLVGEFRRRCDALVILPDRIVLVEGKIVPQPGVIMQLLHYERLIPKTPELEEHRLKPIEKLLLCALEDPVVTQLARDYDVRVATFCPGWIPEYLELLYPRERTPTPTD